MRPPPIPIIASQSGLSTHVLGHYGTFPAEPVRGVCVSSRAGDRLRGAIHPPRLTETLQELTVRPGELDATALAPFLSHPERIDPETDGRPSYLAATLAELATQQAQLTWLLANEDWDLATALFGGLAKLTRAFGAYSVPNNPQAAPADLAIYHRVVDGAYGFFDMMLGALLTIAGPDTTIVLLSVHGFRPEVIPPLGKRPLERTEHWNRPRGVLVAAGPGIQPSEELRGLHIWGAAAMEASLRERRFNLARALLENGRQTADALPLLEALHEESPKDDRVLAALGQAYFAAGRLLDCRRLVDQALADGRGGLLLDLALASLDAESGRPAAALRRLHEISGSQADTAFVSTLKARAFVRLGRWADAGREFKRALELDADAGAAHHGLALTLLARDQPEEAFEAARDAAERLPLHPLSHYYLGLALSRLSRWKEAETALSKALQLSPNLLAAHRRLAHVYRIQGDFARAADCLWEAKQALQRKKELQGE